jgi:hypothetical protein
VIYKHLGKPIRQRLSRTVIIYCFYKIFMLFLPYDHFYGRIMAQNQVQYGAIRSAEELGKLARAHRKERKLTLETISGLGNLSTRFLSEFERGKETAELGKVLKALRTLGLEVVIQARGHAPLKPLPKQDGGSHA